ncbi:hypothetical protein CFOL_v3_31189 [Cephalotus follicularis]|uniref:Uncharacterized protein n=1 Tax=Cephalotus follicularis TaxID=3775 RepID=A0A1Q3D639_CEPFO|nr:hypothetical protein CFOL_v3_31189 [Cephalotus follicularis]
MDTNQNTILSTLFFASIILNFPGMITSEVVCPYPCYPPPTGSGTPSPPATLTPPSQSGSYTPPGYSYPSPYSNLPYYPPPPYGNNLYSPPPPDPILPYFPFYYRKPPHQTNDQSSATTIGNSKVVITTIMNVFVFSLLIV